MWNKRKEEEYPPQPASTPASSANVHRDTHAPIAAAAPTSGFHSPERGTAIIGKSVMIKGQIFSREDLTVDGEVEGAIELPENRLTIGPNGKVRAGIKAREVVVLGTLNGNVEAIDKIDIRKDARLVGDLKTSRIAIEDGAYFKGSIDIVKVETKPAPAPQPAKPAPAPQPAPAVSAAVSGSSTAPVTSATENKR